LNLTSAFNYFIAFGPYGVAHPWQVPGGAESTETRLNYRISVTPPIYFCKTFGMAMDPSSR
jgi:hypothetical protein